MAGRVPQLALRGDALRPVGDEWRADAAFVRPDFVSAEGRVRHGRATGSEAEIGQARTQRHGLVMAQAAHHHLGAGAIVGEKQDERVLHRVHRLKLRQHPADLLVHAVDHRGVDGLFRGLKLLLLVREAFPWHGMPRLTRPEDLQIALLAARGDDLRLRIRQGRVHQPQFLHALESRRPRGRPALRVGVLVLVDVLLRCLHREMRCRESEVGEEGRVGMLLGMLLQKVDRVLRHRRARIPRRV